LEEARVRPAKNKWSENFVDWAEHLEQLVDNAISRQNIKGGFQNSGIIPINKELIVRHLPSTAPSFLTSRSRIATSINLSNSVVTDTSFLQFWQQHEQENQKRKRKKKKVEQEEEQQKEENENGRKGIKLKSEIISREDDDNENDIVEDEISEDLLEKRKRKRPCDMHKTSERRGFSFFFL
jgi:hypothetical protein